MSQDFAAGPITQYIGQQYHAVADLTEAQRCQAKAHRQGGSCKSGKLCQVRQSARRHHQGLGRVLGLAYLRPQQDPVARIEALDGQIPHVSAVARGRGDPP